MSKVMAVGLGADRHRCLHDLRREVVQYRRR